ncbi:MAG: ATP-binding protein [Bacteroidota bacterium]
MDYNRVTLAFPAGLEKVFREKYFTDSLRQLRVAFVMVTLLYASFGYLDRLTVPQYVTFFHLIRYMIVVPLLTTVLLLSFTPFFRKVWQELIMFCAITGGVGISIMTMLAPDNYAYYAGVMLVYSALYFFVKLRFLSATISGWLILLFYNLGAVYYSRIDPVLLMTNNFFFVAANLIGMFAAYYIEYYARRNFFLNIEIDRQKEAVMEANKNLEEIVTERTYELVEAKNRAERADQLKTAFLANMSHEIRTPMNGILGFADLLKEPRLTGEQQQHYLSIIESSGVRMLNIINEIIDISKIESGTMEIDISEINIYAVLKDLSVFFRPEIEQKGLRLIQTCSLTPEEAVLHTDREKLFAILINLVKNAIKYTPSGEIEFGCTLKDDNFEFFVRDTGIGIPPEMHNIIFERFIQADLSNKRAYQGAGLGLAIVKSYLAMLGGKIWVDSIQGKGSVFYFTLPFRLKTPTGDFDLVSDLSFEQTDNKSNGQPKILVAEDDEVSEEFLKVILKPWAREILFARNGTQAVSLCREHPDIDIVLMDIQMPDLNGYEATRRIRTFNTKVRIIAQTAYGFTSDRDMVLEAGCDDYISKPIRKEELISLLAGRKVEG